MISYCWANKHIVLSVADDLERSGFKFWLDRTNMGVALNESIIDGILRSRVIVPFIWEDYVDSHVCKQEVKFANEHRKPFLPVRLEKTPKVETSVAAFVTAGQIYIDLDRNVWANDVRRGDALGRIRDMLTQARGTPSSTVPVDPTASPQFHATSPTPPAVDPIVRQLTKSGAGGDPAAQFMLAMRHQFAVGTAADLSRAAFWIEMAANNTQALYYSVLHYAVMLALGEGFPRSVAEADRLNLGGQPQRDKIERELKACAAVDPGAKRVLRKFADWIQSRAEEGCAFAQYAFAEVTCHENDFSEAARWYHAAAAQDHASAQADLGVMYRDGKGVAKDVVEAARWFRKAAEQGNAWGQDNLGALYRDGDGVPRDVAEAARWFRKAAEQGNESAENRLGILYRNGEGVAEDLAEAARWFRRAADRGNAWAQSNLGGLYRNGDGVAKDTSEAARWFRKAAEQGNSVGQNNLGALYRDGDGVPKDPAEAARWFRKAADQGLSTGQYNLGRLYKHGEGVPKDLDEAARWFQRAADQGNPFGQLNLGALYKSGEGVAAKDLAEAARWFQKAAEQGNALAQLNLGRMYLSGEGVEKDAVEARKWLGKAAEQGNGDAKRRLEQLG
ncbi:hypothetical protein DFJ73DRAFT_198070 [Zopfochytrium polystomum]|nr:hypothetical protein DFJ73DRAFT_198070 [Zopfochytrium polystomum]